MSTPGKNGSPVIPARQVEISGVLVDLRPVGEGFAAEISSGVWVNLYPIPKGFAVDKRDARPLMRRKLGIKDRQVRAAISSYSVEDWAYHGANGTLFGVSSLDHRMLEHVDRRVDSRILNGRKGGRPPKPTWDVTPSSGIKQRQVIETIVAEHERL